LQAHIDARKRLQVTNWSIGLPLSGQGRALAVLEGILDAVTHGQSWVKERPRDGGLLSDLLASACGCDDDVAYLDALVANRFSAFASIASALLARKSV
jgi:hypothetical protein